MSGYVRSLWVELLGVAGDDITVHGNFFELGGDSLSAEQLAQRANVDLDLDLDILAVFDNAEFHEFVTLLEAESSRARATRPDVQD